MLSLRSENHIWRKRRWLWNEAATSEMTLSEKIRVILSAKKAFTTSGWLKINWKEWREVGTLWNPSRDRSSQTRLDIGENSSRMRRRILAVGNTLDNTAKLIIVAVVSLKSCWKLGRRLLVAVKSSSLLGTILSVTLGEKADWAIVAGKLWRLSSFRDSEYLFHRTYFHVETLLDADTTSTAIQDR